MELIEDYEGHCPVCDIKTVFQARNEWLRGHLNCRGCAINSVPRERAVALILNELRPNWRELAIHESSPARRGISVKLAQECRDYTPTHYHADKPYGAKVGDHYNENIEHQTFAGERFDIVVSQDVMEHIFDPARAYSEIWRTLKPGGIYIHTFPIFKSRVEAVSKRAEAAADGTITYLKEAQYHGNPIDAKGSLVTIDYGYEIHGVIAKWVPFDVRVMRFADRWHGILGEFTEVVVCYKRGAR